MGNPEGEGVERRAEEEVGEKEGRYQTGPYEVVGYFLLKVLT